MANLSGAPVPAKMQGKEYRVFPLTDKDHDELNLWTQREQLRRIKRITRDTDYLGSVMLQIAEMTWQGSKMFLSLDGFTKLLAVTCREDKIPVDFAKTLNEEDIQEFWDAFNMAHGLVEEGNGEVPKTEPASDVPKVTDPP